VGEFPKADSRSASRRAILFLLLIIFTPTPFVFHQKRRTERRPVEMKMAVTMQLERAREEG
jgi:hypothetical protein